MIVKEILVLEEAVDDLAAGKYFYEQRAPGVGIYFWDSLIADIESLVIYAGIHPKQYGLYRMLAKRFPYAVYYDFKDHIVSIVAILPLRRDPEWIEKQVGGRK